MGAANCAEGYGEGKIATIGREDGGRGEREGRKEGGYFDEEFSPPTVRINSRIKRPAARQSRARMAGSARLTFVRLIN